MAAKPVIPIHSGDIRVLSFKVVDENGTAVNLSGYTDIDLAIYALDGQGNPTGAALASDNLAGDLDLVGGGTGGEFSWTTVAGDTSGLAGDYYVEVRLETSGGLFNTCSPAVLRVLEDLITS